MYLLYTSYTSMRFKILNDMAGYLTSCHKWVIFEENNFHKLTYSNFLTGKFYESSRESSDKCFQ